MKLICVSTAFLAACGPAQSGSSIESKAKAVVPVSKLEAPTVRHLASLGYENVDYHEKSFDCGPGCIGDGQDAIYLDKSPKQSPTYAYDFECPVVPDVSEQDWKCRALGTFNG